jgi:hypothetical protein
MCIAPFGRDGVLRGPGVSFEPEPPSLVDRARGAVAIDDPRLHGRYGGSARALPVRFSLPRGARGPELNRRDNA